MDTIFSPKIRDQAIETTCSNLIKAGLLLPCEVAKCMTHLSRTDDVELALTLIEAREQYNHYLEHWNLN